ncbi:GNAT family N-acetyltransferase [Marixanthomonas sp. SCSIO 43207]|uniref:GNAT family N-acetyltransferase n=1 Tax=Marixanthomonas sp. SCSIO 43207 TaxID=2779360 RepID=UPI001CA9BDD9|nr:GNAT family N-acetyltransferase [Marixanthomonas sp. SCSIO 43207]UAB81955.1 GNAT family N-acetyltransferase [Marixanthomonas sp. SCSIO 43207]
MEITIKKFEDLSIYELYDILQLRSEVFVVEQDCVYQDIDGKDANALHIIGKKDGKIIAYTRCFAPGYYFDEAAIGRVVVAKDQRSFKYGHDIMDASKKAIKKYYHTENIKLSAQQYLIKFYQSHGFQPIGEGYLEDGIPHIAMVIT